MTFLAFAAGGWWAGFVVTSVALSVLAAVVVAVITTVNRIERQAASIVVHLDASAAATRPLLDLVEVNEALAGLVAGGT
jgi:heme exporter protein D